MVTDGCSIPQKDSCLGKTDILSFSGPRRRNTVQNLGLSFLLMGNGWCQKSGQPREECELSGSHRARFSWCRQARKDTRHQQLTLWGLASSSLADIFLQLAISWAAADFFMHIPFVAVVWHSARTSLPQVPSGLVSREQRSDYFHY